MNQTMKKNMSICFPAIGSNTFYQIKFHLRAGKIGKNRCGKYKHVWNININQV